MLNKSTQLLLLVLTSFFSITSTFAAPAIQQWQTRGGTTVLFYPTHQIPMLELHVAFHAGSAMDTQPGISALTTELINQGNAGMNAADIAAQFADVGAQFNQEVTREAIILSLRTLTTPLAQIKAFTTFQKLINHPDFPEKALQREKRQLLLSQQQSLESPERLAEETFYRVLYQQHPYAHPLEGNSISIKGLTRTDITQFYHQFFVQKNAVIVIVGAIDKPAAETLANQLLSELPLGLRAHPIKPATPPVEEINIEVPFDATQVSVRLGTLGITPKDPDYFPMQVGNYILGGSGLTSRLAHALREQRGLTYDVSTQFIPLPGKGPFIIRFSTKPEDLKRAMALTRKILTDFIQSGPTEDELKHAKDYLVGSFPLTHATNQSMSRILLNLALYDLPLDYLDTYLEHIVTVTRQDIQHVFQQRIQPKTLIQIQVG